MKQSTWNTCTSEFRSWLGSNLLKFNANKTDVLILATSLYLHAVTDYAVLVGDVSILSNQFFRNLGVVFDQILSMKQRKTLISLYVNNASSNYEVLDVRTPFICRGHQDRGTYVHRIEDRLWQLIGILDRCTARLVTNTHNYNHIKPVLKRLHSLPAKQRIVSKILLLVSYKALHGLTPPFICELVQLKQPDRQLWSDNLSLLKIPNT